MRFGISTHLYHDQRLSRDHLREIADHGFEAVELFATRTHFDYHDASAVEELDAWLRDTGLTLHAIHAPVTESLVNDRWGPAYSNATTDDERRTATVHETDRALNVARRIATEFLVVHVGTPDSLRPHPEDNDRDAARRSLEQLERLVDPLGVRLALEVIPNALSTVVSLTGFLEDELTLPAAGICMDFGHAFLMGEVVDAIEAASGHLITTHVHDNHGTRDDHLTPFDGGIDWAAALITAQKIGYDGTWMMEVANTGRPVAVLEAARRARGRLEDLLG